jgi:hypothetical protein
LFCVCAISSNEIILLRFTNAISLESQMIVSSASDYREAARRKLPRFLFDYIDGGANAEQTLKANIADLIGVSLRQRVLKDVSDLSLGTECPPRSR